MTDAGPTEQLEIQRNIKNLFDLMGWQQGLYNELLTKDDGGPSKQGNGGLQNNSNHNDTRQMDNRSSLYQQNSMGTNDNVATPPPTLPFSRQQSRQRLLSQVILKEFSARDLSNQRLKEVEAQ